MNADILIINAKAITFDEDNPQADTIAVTGNKLSFVGRATAAELTALQGPDTKVIDAKGATVTPGIIESHVHIFMGAVELATLQLAEISGADDLQVAVRAYADQHRDERLVFANGIDYLVFGDNQNITRQRLDDILPDRPLAVMSADHHTVWGNTKALELGNLLHGADLPEGNEVVMADDGLASGELREVAAFEPLMAYIPTKGRATLGFTTASEPEPYPETEELAQDMAIMKRGLDHCARQGITTIHNMDGNFYQFELLQALLDRGDLSCRVNSPFHLKNTADLSRLKDAEAMREHYNSDMLWSGRVKIFIDGVLESRTALMLEDYSDAPGVTGDPVFSAEHFNKAAIAADALGLQITVHAIGDGGVRRTLDGYEAAQKANGVRDSRHRIEHIEVIDGADVNRLTQLGVIASMQPLHAPGTGAFSNEPIVKMLGPERIKLSTPWQTLKNTGARLIFSSDWPVVPVEPMLSIKGAMMRQAVVPDMPDQRQSLHDALHAYTVEAAYCEFNEERKGRLKTGMLADIAVFDSDMDATAPEKLDQVLAVTTICDGRITYQA